MYEGKSKSKGAFQKSTFIVNIQKQINITFQRNPPRLQRAGSSISHISLITSEKKVFFVASLTSFSPRQFLERIVTADETWVHHYEPESKAQSVAWKRPTSPMAKKFKSQPSAGKIMLTLFWNMEGAILVHSTPKGLDLAPRDFHTFDPMKEALRRSSSDEEVIGAMPNWLRTQQKKSDGIKKLVIRWNRCIEIEGEYVEK
jgi:hypothetical protein